MQDLRSITAAILVGGQGTRLRAVLPGRQKVIAEVNGKPFLCYLLDSLARAGVSEVVLCVGYKARQVQAEIGNSYGDISLVYSFENEPLGTGGALRLALERIHSEEFLVLNGDSYCDVDLSRFWKWHQEKKAECSLVLTKVQNVARYGSVIIDYEQRVLCFEEKNNVAREGLINAGVYLINRRLLQKLPEGNVSLEKTGFPTWLKHGVYGYVWQGKFIDIGTPDSYAEASKFFAPL